MHLFALVATLALAQTPAPKGSTSIYDSLKFADEKAKQPDAPKEKRIVAQGRRYALVVGVGEAKPPGFQLDKLPECITDAETLSTALRANGYECITLSEKSKSPTKANAVASLKEICAKATETDQIVVYFSTHGGYINGQSSLALKDAILELREVKAELAASKALVRVMLLDCCRDQKNYPAITSEFRDIHMVLSCRPDEESITGDHGLSVFTEVLVEALTDCKADRVKDGRLEIDEILYYLDDEVPKRADTAQPGHSQNPTRTVIDPRSVNPILASCEKAPDPTQPQPVAVEGPVRRAPRNDLIISAALAGKVAIGMTPEQMYEKMGQAKDDTLTLDDSGKGLILYADVPQAGDTTFVFFDKGKVMSVVVMYKQACDGAFDRDASSKAVMTLLDGRALFDLQELLRGLSPKDLFEKIGCPSTAVSTTVGKAKAVYEYANVPTPGIALRLIVEDEKVSEVKVEVMQKK